MKKIALLGSTGSIGRSTLKVVRHLAHELKITVLAARSNLDLLQEQVKEFNPELVAIGDEQKAAEFRRRMPHIQVVHGIEGLCQAASLPVVDLTLFAMTGISALKPALAAIDQGKTIAIANKEILVCAGELIMRRAKEKNVSVLPVDSEHSAIFQCLEKDHRSVRRLILTTSGGGPFRSYSIEQLATITLEQALNHPNFRMGTKNTIDSSTLMNKGLEIIEARHLFGVEAIDVVVHPQQIIHSMVEYVDGSILAQMSEPDMCLPIQYALTYPRRLPGPMAPFDFQKSRQMEFEEPDRKKFPCLRLAEEALKAGRSYPCFMNAANEVLVDSFVKGSFRWGEIASRLEKLMSSHSPFDVLTLDSILAADREARDKAGKL